MIQYSLEVGICWAILYVIYIIFLRKETFFDINRWYLVGSLLAGLIIPIVKLIPVPTTEQSAKISEAFYFISAGPELIASNLSVESKVSTFWSLSNLLMILYAVGFLVFTFKMFHGLGKIYKLYSNGVKESKSSYTLVKTNSFHLPFSFMNYVFVSEEIQLNTDIKKILDHELVHVQSWHSIDVMFIEILQIIFWFNPLIYLYKKAIKESHEFIADATVLRDTPLEDYKQTLVNQIQVGLQVSLANNFFHNDIKNRVEMMSCKKSSSKAVLKYFIVIPFLIGLCFLFQFEIVKGSEVIQNSNTITEMPSWILVNGERTSMSADERHKMKGFEILSGQEIEEKFGFNSVYNFFDADHFITDFGEAKGEYYQDNNSNEWFFKYTSDVIGNIPIQINDKNYNAVKKFTYQKNDRVLIISLKELDCALSTYQLEIFPGEGTKSATFGMFDFSKGIRVY